MSVSSTARKEQFTLDQSEAHFDFTFRALTSTPTDIKCMVTTGTTNKILTYTTDYTVAVDSDGVGGRVTLVSPSTLSKGTLTIYRETTNKQQSDYEDYSQFPANTLENDLDIRTMVAQENAEDMDRTVKLPVSSTLTDLELPTPAAGKALKWNAGETALVNSTVDIEDIDTAVASALASQVAAASSATVAITQATISTSEATTAVASAVTAQATLKVAVTSKTANYTIALADVDKMIAINSAGNITLTVPLNADIAIPTGSVVGIIQIGAGKIVITPTNGTVVVNREFGLTTTGSYATAALLKTDTNTWLAFGALEA